MAFDKNKTMRIAERYLAQGRFLAAIKEYNSVVENDPDEVNTLNMIGDLHIKADDQKAAIDCFKKAADYFHLHGFEKKAIAVYNKIHRLEPSSPDVSIQLAQLYQKRGSIAEARGHFENVANAYEKKGDNFEALRIWEQLAEIAPKDTGIYLKIAEFHWKTNQKEEAAKAFIEGGTRLAEGEKHEEAIAAFSRALEVVPEELVAVRGFVNSQVSLGYPEEAVKVLDEIYFHNPNNVDVVHLMVDCYLDMDEAGKGEVILVDLIANEPKAYTKMLDIVDYYLKRDDLDSSIRTVSMISEQLMVSQKPERLCDLLNEIIARNPEQVQALRLLARYFGWHKNEVELQRVLEHLLEAANYSESVEDERYAITQLLMLSPQEDKYIKRLKKINGVSDESNVSDKSEVKAEKNSVPTFEAYNGLLNGNEPSGNPSEKATEYPLEEHGEITLTEDDLQTEAVEESNDDDNGLNIKEQLENLRFYIDEGYLEIAEQTIKELDEEHGVREEFDEIRETLEEQRRNFPSESNEGVFGLRGESSNESVNQVDAGKAKEALLAEESFVQDYALGSVSGDQIVGTKTETDSIEEKKEEDNKAQAAAPETDESKETDENSSEDESISDESETESDSVSKATSSEEESEKNNVQLEEEAISSKIEIGTSIVANEDKATAKEISSKEPDEARSVDALMPNSETEEPEIAPAVTEEVAPKEVAQDVKESVTSLVAEEPEIAPAVTEEAAPEEVAQDVKESVTSLVAEEPEIAPAITEEVAPEEVAQDVKESVTSLVAEEPEIVPAVAEEVAPKEVAQDVETETETKSISESEESLSVDDFEKAEKESDSSVQSKIAEQADSNVVAPVDASDSDEEFETHYHHAVAYKEMGLLGDAIREFQDAVGYIEVNDGTERFLQCCTLLGHCFLEQNASADAVKWFEKAFDVKDLGEVEKIALNYEIGNAYSQDSNFEKAVTFFEKIHSLDSEYRDVTERLEECVEKSNLVTA